MWIILIFTFAAVVLLALPLQATGLLVESVIDFGHYLLFALISLAMGLATSRKELSLTQRVALVVGLPLTFGALIEGIQPYLGRTGSYYDLWLDVLGVAAGWFAYRGWTRRPQPSYRTLVGLSLLTLLALQQPLWWSWVYRERQRALPDLLGLESRPLHSLLTNNLNTPLKVTPVPDGLDLPQRDRSMVRVPLFGATWPGIHWREPESDWRAYSGLEIEIYSPLPREIPLVLRIHDHLHDQRFEDRFNRRLRLQPGYNRFEIAMTDISHAPQDRLMNLAAIEGIILFSTPQAKGDEIYLLGVRLIPAESRSRSTPETTGV